MKYLYTLILFLVIFASPAGAQTQTNTGMIGSLPNATTLTGSELVPLQQNGKTVKTTTNNFLHAGGTPGGTNGQIQYNNNGVFGGLNAAQLTASLNNFTEFLPGLVPAPSTATGTKYLNDLGTFTTPAGGGSGTVTTTGSPANGNLSVFSGATSITNGNLSGDITTSSALTTTLATVNSNVGSFGSSTAIPSFTTNAKGLMTAAGTNVVIAPAGTLTGTTLASNVVTSSLTALGTIVTGVWSATRLLASEIPTDVAYFDVSQIFSASQRATLQSITIATSTFTPNFNTGADFSMVLVHASCPCTLANPSTTPVAGQHGIFYIQQSSTGSDTIGTWGSDYESSGGTSTISLSTAGSATDVMSYTVQDSTHIILSPVVANVSH